MKFKAGIRTELLDDWFSYASVNPKCFSYSTYYFGEQSIVIYYVEKNEVESANIAYISLLKKMVETDHLFPIETIENMRREALENFYDNVLWEYVENYNVKELNIDNLTTIVSENLRDCLETRDEYKEKSIEVIEIINMLFSSPISLKGYGLIDLWNEKEYFIESDNHYILYHWDTSA